MSRNDSYNSLALKTTNESQHATLLKQLSGLLLPTTTPFAGNGNIDGTSFAANLERWSQTRVSGFVIFGSTGERVHLDEREYRELLGVARKSISTDRAFISGAGQQSVRGSINEIKLAAEYGADAVLVITPFFYRTAITQLTLIDYYNAVADASRVPVMLYSMPALTGVKIEPETIARLSSHPNIIGVKDSSNDMAGFAETVKVCPPEFAVMTGNGTVLLDALKLGATGGILAVGCAVPEVCLEVIELFRSGNLAQADSLQSKLTPLAAAVTTRFGIGGLKTAMDIVGYAGGNVRAPLASPTDAQRTEIAELLEGVSVTTSKN